MIPRRLMLLLGIGLAVLCLAAPAWAHPGHDGPLATSGLQADGRAQTAPDSRGVADSWDALGRQAPAATLLVVAALALLAAVPHRRRALALALVLLLSTVSLEGLLHAAMHLHHVAHADGLAIGASSTQQAATGPNSEAASPTPVIQLGEILESYDAPVPDLVVSSGRGRAPPVSLA